jgi:hypothetical protein
MSQGDKPRSEPEIIPPDRGSRRTQRERIFVSSHGPEQIYVARVGPVGAILTVLIVAILLAVMLALLMGALLIWLPLVVLFVAGVIIVGIVRTFFFKR